MILRGGTVVDGASATRADIRITGPVIDAVGPDIQGPGEFDASGLDVLPGFIDVHSHDDVAVLKPGFLEPKVRQGVTLTVVGNCGHGCAPSVGELLEDYSTPVLGRFPGDRKWLTFPQYLDDVAAGRRTTNVAALVPHGPLRFAAVGAEQRPATPAEMAGMCAALDDALSAGAAGLSLGLMYTPGNAATGEELAALARIVARHGKLLVAHIRNEGHRIVESLDEMLRLARSADCAVHISHLKVASPANHGRMPEIVETLDSARDSGIDVTADIYPYIAGSTTVATLFPLWALDGGVESLLSRLRNPAERRRIQAAIAEPWSELENNFRSVGPSGIVLSGFSLPEHAGFEATTLADVAGTLELPPAEALCELVLAERARMSIIVFHMDEADVRVALAWPWTMIGSDGLPVESGNVHPRLYGTFPRVLTAYAETISFPEATRRMTSLPAGRFGLRGRGVIEPGAAADLVIADRARLRDVATYENPRRFPEGIVGVVVGGEFAWQGAAPTRNLGELVRIR